MSTHLTIRQLRSWLQTLDDAGAAPDALIEISRNMLMLKGNPLGLVFFPEAPPPWQPRGLRGYRGELCRTCFSFTPQPRLPGPLVGAAREHVAYWWAERARPSDPQCHYWDVAPYRGCWVLHPLSADETRYLERDGWQVRPQTLAVQGHRCP